MDKFTSGRIVGADNRIHNVVDILEGQPISNEILADVSKLKPHSGVIIGEDGKGYDLKTMLKNAGNGNTVEYDDSELRGLIAQKAPIHNASLTGQPTAPSPTIDSGIATKAYVDEKVEEAGTGGTAYDDSELRGLISQKAPIHNAALTGQPTAPSPTIDSGIATKAYVDSKLDSSGIQMRLVNKYGAVNAAESEQYLQIFNNAANVWEWINYPLSIADVSYRTNRRTKDGAVIYARIFKVNSFPNNQEGTHILDFVTNYVTSLKGWAYRANNTLVYELPYRDTYQSSADILTNVNGNKYLKIKTWGDRTDISGLFIVEYC